MLTIKIENELNETALGYLYKDIMTNWSNNVDHSVVLTEVIHQDDKLNRFASKIIIDKLKPVENKIIMRCYRHDERGERKEVDNVDDFKYTYMKMLNWIKNATEKDLTPC